MDWGMLDNPTAVVGQTLGTCIPAIASPEMKCVSCVDVALRPRLCFGTALTLAVVMIDVCLQYSWTLRFIEHAIFPSNDVYILCMEVLVVFCHTVWNLLRVEWEHIKQTRSVKKIPSTPTSTRMVILAAAAVNIIPSSGAIVRRGINMNLDFALLCSWPIV